MKYLVFVFAIAIISCNSSSVSKTPNNPAPSKSVAEGSNLISFKVNGELVRTSGWVITRFSYHNNPERIWLNITSNMKEEEKTINVNLNGSLPGSYSFGGTALKKESHGSYFPNYLEDLGRSYSFVKGNFTLTEVDTVHHLVSGYFSGTVKNLKGETLEITEGKIIKGKLNWNIIRYE